MKPARKTSADKISSTKKPADLVSRARDVGRTCTARTARSVSRRIIQIHDRHLAPHGFTLPQFVMLTMIAGARDDTLAAIADAAGLDPSTLTRNLQGLEKLGLVEVAAVESDQRKRSVWLTETGARRLSAAIPAWEAAQKEVTEKVGDGFLSSLRRAEKALED